jgi:hypothetical protein
LVADLDDATAGLFIKHKDIADRKTNSIHIGNKTPQIA